MMDRKVDNCAFYDEIERDLDSLKQNGQLRTLRTINHTDNSIEIDGRSLINLASNDYLGLASNMALKEHFLDTIGASDMLFSASSSRLLTGNFECMQEVESKLAHYMGTESSLVFNSGYHMNLGILPAISDAHTLILADKLVHASIIDGMRLSKAKSMRYRHNDYRHLESLLIKYSTEYKRIIIVTESIFSMDGDEADLQQLVVFKHTYNNILLYVDEAHAFGVRGKQGMGCVEELGLHLDIDFIVGTFGKAGASVGAYVACKKVVRSYLINTMRSLIFSTALAPINWMWTNYMLDEIVKGYALRVRLEELGTKLRNALNKTPYASLSTSHIIPIVIGSSSAALLKAQQLEDAGFLALAVRPPTVAKGSARIRLSLSPLISDDELSKLIDCILKY